MFLDVLFPDRVSRAIQLNRNPNIEILTADSFYEQRNLKGPTRREFTCRVSLASLSEITSIVALWEAVEGNTYSFRCRDWSQYAIGYTLNGSVLEPSTPGVIGAGTGTQTTFQIVQRYTYGSVTKDVKVTKPRNSVDNPVEVFVNGTKLTSGWTLDDSTGVITFSSAPANTHPVAVRCIYDVPMRFDGPLPIDLETGVIGSTGSLKLIEVFGE